MKVCRCYLKHYPKWSHYHLSLEKQRDLILDRYKEYSDLQDDEIELPPEMLSLSKKILFVVRKRWTEIVEPMLTESSNDNEYQTSN